jgi:hypothetical protein
MGITLTSKIGTTVFELEVPTETLHRATSHDVTLTIHKFTRGEDEPEIMVLSGLSENDLNELMDMWKKVI